MKSNVALVGLAAALLGACGTNGNTTTQTSLGLTATNYITITPATTTLVPPSTSAGNPGLVHPEEGQYTLTAEDIYASRVAAKFKVKLEDLLSINNVTLDANGFAVGWPPAGTVIRIPPGWTEPGAPTDTTPSSGTTAQTPAPTTTLPGGKCPPGEYTIVAGDYEGKVATKLNTTVEALRAVNATTPGYSSFYPGLKIKTPPKASC